MAKTEHKPASAKKVKTAPPVEPIEPVVVEPEVVEDVFAGEPVTSEEIIVAEHPLPEPEQSFTHPDPWFKPRPQPKIPHVTEGKVISI